MTIVTGLTTGNMQLVFETVYILDCRTKELSGGSKNVPANPTITMVVEEQINQSYCDISH